MAEQFSFADLAWSSKGKTTKREDFLNEMDQVIPWKKLTALIAPPPMSARNIRGSIVGSGRSKSSTPEIAT